MSIITQKRITQFPPNSKALTEARVAAIKIYEFQIAVPKSRIQRVVKTSVWNKPR